MQISLDGKVKTKNSVLALGMFDGVHIGHGVLLERAKVLAKQQRVPLVACTFTMHPRALIAPEKCPPALTTLEERAALMEEKGVDILCAQPFDREMMNLEPEAYIAGLCRQFRPLFIVIGYNFTFGKGGEGNPALLKALEPVFGFSTQVVPKITIDGQGVSATAIRRCLQKGEVSKAMQMLGHPYEVSMIAERQEGEIIFSVIESNGKQNPARGIYRVTLQQREKWFPGLLVVTGENTAKIRGRIPFARGERIQIRLYQKYSGI